mgnify:CR=1 FL=1
MKKILNILKDSNLKITPQRVVVLQAVLQLDHPTVDQILKRVGQKNPSISQGTVYKTLQTLVDKGIIERVKTDTGKMRYDTVQGNHHHLYSIDSERIADYSDNELDDLLKKYFERKKIPGFEILNVRLQITGKFSNEKNRK